MKCGVKVVFVPRPGFNIPPPSGVGRRSCCLERCGVKAISETIVIQESRTQLMTNLSNSAFSIVQALYLVSE